jgi:cbb3-type cytochrome c oxidase subunit III
MKRSAWQVAVVVGFLFVVCLGAGRGESLAIREENSSQATQDAATLFKRACATCHGKDGRAKTFKAKFNGARNLADTTWQESVTDERIFNSISNGRGKKMPAFGNKFSQAEIEALAAHVRGFKK